MERTMFKTRTRKYTESKLVGPRRIPKRLIRYAVSLLGRYPTHSVPPRIADLIINRSIREYSKRWNSRQDRHTRKLNMIYRLQGYGTIRTREAIDNNPTLRELAHSLSKLPLEYEDIWEALEAIRVEVEKSQQSSNTQVVYDLADEMYAIEKLLGRRWTHPEPHMVEIEWPEIHTLHSPHGNSIDCGPYLLVVQGDTGRLNLSVHPDDDAECSHLGHVHPHIGEEGDICWGSAARDASDALREWQIYYPFMLLHQILSEYNHQSPFCTIEDWTEHLESCAECGAEIRPSEDMYVELDGSYWCDDCIGTCAHTGLTLPLEHLTLIEGGRYYDRRICNDYVEECERCNEAFYEGDLVNSPDGPICEDCKQELDEEREEEKAHEENHQITNAGMTHGTHPNQTILETWLENSTSEERAQYV